MANPTKSPLRVNTIKSPLLKGQPNKRAHLGSNTKKLNQILYGGAYEKTPLRTSS